MVPCYRDRMCNLYTWKMTAEEMRALKLHFQLIGTTWTEWEERQRRQNEPVQDVYPNRRAPVLTLQDGQHVVREDMFWGFPPFKPGAGYGTNFTESWSVSDRARVCPVKASPC